MPISFQMIPQESGGVIYLCDHKSLTKMDQYEGISKGDYVRISVTVKNDSGGKVKAIAYIAGKDFLCDPSKPTDEYLGKIISGARYHGLPDEYIRSIELLAK